MPMDNIPVVNKIKTYDFLYFEIVGTCNAKCRFCVTGVSNHPKGGIIEVDKFQKAVDILFENKLIDCNTEFGLYNWGEPTLHPDLGKIIDVLQNKNLMYFLSTNAGKHVQYQPEWFKNMSGMRISMCGFSQESYNRIHGFNFEEVKKNIVSIVEVAEKASYNTHKICIAQHIYQFNTHEVSQLYEFSAKLNISFDPYYASINDPMMLRKYIDNRLEPQEWKEISQNIFCHFIQKRRDLHPRNYCYQFDILNLDERGNILPCCCLPRDHADYILTNIFDKNFMEVLGKWQPTETCRECIKAGLSPLKTLGDSFSFTNFTVPSEPSFVEVIYLVVKKIKRRSKMILHKVKKIFTKKGLNK
ncbi:MAG: radical SAM protein [Planctomycetaceae bacterium]|jgi:MoaA/NifB/PqqE/SkfB family radical SAM enzyme|nr:radical SAM protein [Planctomycetaceae bacterium]